MSQSYEIVFYGKLVEGFTEDVTKQHVAQLFKTEVAQVERMFTGKRVVIRNKLDWDTANKYVLAMQKRGAQCQIEAMGAPGVEVTAEAGVVVAESPPVAATFSSREAVAPNQAASQPMSPAANQEVASKSGLKLAGDKVDEILADAHLGLDPVGIRLSEEHEEKAPDLPGLDAMSIAPIGADLSDEKEDVPVSVPDTSHLTLK